MTAPAVVLDTNVFVAAGFNEDSHSATLIEAIRADRIRLLWDEETFEETQAVVRKIPPLDWDRFERIFRPEFLVPAAGSRRNFSEVEDPQDRKFAALADRADAPLVTNDDHLLSAGDDLRLTIITPRQATAELLKHDGDSP